MPEPESASPSFEHALEALEAIVCELEEGQIGLAESLAKYEQGVGLLRQCYDLLSRAERRIELLSRVEPTGEVVAEPFDDSPTAESTTSENTASTRSRRRSRSKAPAETAQPPRPEPKDETGMDVQGGLF